MPTTVKTPNRPIVITASAIDYPSTPDERELLWLFECAEQEIANPSSWEPLVSTALDGSRKERGGRRDFHERRADAFHKANVIVGWLEKMPRSVAEVLVAAYRPRCWSPRYELTFRRLSGIVPTLPVVRAAYECAIDARETSASDIVAWLEEVILDSDDDLLQLARREADVVYRQALLAYRAARGDGPPLVGDP
jgi:hypothetical protein